MPLTIQSGDLATRLARAFGIRGRIPSALDENVVPVTIVERSDLPPFPDVPSYWSISASVGGAAATRAMLGVRVISGVAVVDRILTTMISAAGTVTLQLNRQQTTNLNTTDQIFTLNRQTRANVGPEVPRPAMRLVQADQAAIPGLQVGGYSAAINTPIEQQPGGLCLYTNDELLAVCSNLNQFIRCDMYGRWYPQVG